MMTVTATKTRSFPITFGSGQNNLDMEHVASVTPAQHIWWYSRHCYYNTLYVDHLCFLILQYSTIPALGYNLMESWKLCGRVRLGLLRKILLSVWLGQYWPVVSQNGAKHVASSPRSNRTHLWGPGDVAICLKPEMHRDTKSVRRTRTTQPLSAVLPHPRPGRRSPSALLDSPKSIRERDGKLQPSEPQSRGSLWHRPAPCPPFGPRRA